MTVIACKVTKATIELAGDTQTTFGEHKLSKIDSTDAHVKASGKIWTVDRMTFGCAGLVGQIGLLQVFAKTHKPKQMDRDAVIQWFLEFKYYCQSDAKIPVNDLSVHGIVIMDGLAFQFNNHLEVFRIKNFTAIGSGMFLAIGAMECGKTPAQACAIAAKYDLYCSKPITKLTILR